MREDKLDHLAQPYPVTEREAHELLRSADAAIYQAKRDGQRQAWFHGKIR